MSSAERAQKRYEKLKKSVTNVKMYDYATPNEKHKNAKAILYVYVKVYIIYTGWSFEINPYP